MSEPNHRSALNAIFVAATDYMSHRTKTFDQWAQDNPEQAAAAGFVIGLAISVLFNKALMIKGAMATASAALGALKGATTGYGYARARRYAVVR